MVALSGVCAFRALRMPLWTVRGAVRETFGVKVSRDKGGDRENESASYPEVEQFATAGLPSLLSGAPACSAARPSEPASEASSSRPHSLSVLSNTNLRPPRCNAKCCAVLLTAAPLWPVPEHV